MLGNNVLTSTNGKPSLKQLTTSCLGISRLRNLF